MRSGSGCLRIFLVLQGALSVSGARLSSDRGRARWIGVFGACKNAGVWPVFASVSKCLASGLVVHKRTAKSRCGWVGDKKDLLLSFWR